MPTHVEIDETLLAEAMKAGGFETGEASVEEALRRMIRAIAQREALDALHGIG